MNGLDSVRNGSTQITATQVNDYQGQSEEAQVQDLLARNGYPPYGGSDGWFGPCTQAAVMEFQRANGLPVTGEIDEVTLQVLETGTRPDGGAVVAGPGQPITEAGLPPQLRPQPAEDATSIVAPPQNGTLATGRTDESGREQFQNYVDGEPVGEPYYANVAANGVPANSRIVNPQGEIIRTDGDGEPKDGVYTELAETADAGVYRNAEVTYVDGVVTRTDFTDGPAVLAQ